MSRTVRISRKTQKVVRDGIPQYVSSSCRHHGGCKYCENNRTINFRKIKQIFEEDLIEFLDDFSND